MNGNYEVCGGNVPDLGCKQWINTTTTHHIIAKPKDGTTVYMHHVPCFRFAEVEMEVLREVNSSRRVA